MAAQGSKRSLEEEEEEKEEEKKVARLATTMCSGVAGSASGCPDFFRYPLAQASRVAGPGVKLVVKILGVAPDSAVQPDPEVVARTLLHEPFHVVSASSLAPHQCQTCGKVEFENFRPWGYPVPNEPFRHPLEKSS